MEETEKPRYPKDLHVGRIVIEEIPEEKTELDRRQVLQRDVVKASHQDMKTPSEVENVSAKHVKGDIVQVGKLSKTDYEKTTTESGRVQETTTSYTESFGKGRKVQFLSPKRLIFTSLKLWTQVAVCNL